jgi:hypothetical protein
MLSANKPIPITLAVQSACLRTQRVVYLFPTGLEQFFDQYEIDQSFAQYTKKSHCIMETTISVTNLDANDRFDNSSGAAKGSVPTFSKSQPRRKAATQIID